MRRTNEQKAETRQHIVEAAGRLFRQHGIDAVGVDAIMHAAGLTHGGFYGHFPSKEALVAEVADGLAGAFGGAVGADRAGRPAGCGAASGSSGRISTRRMSRRWSAAAC